MSQEIVFTSARHGLRTGSTGFCTVRSTRGMPGNLAQLLERLTGYQHAFDAYGDESNLNPVNFAHYTTRLGDQRFHILARVSNAPLDHTNRSNKLAHLLAVDGNHLEAQLSEGPASESLQIPWVRDWSSDTAPCVLPDEKQIDLPMANQPKPGTCNFWKEATGDTGWAAVLAATAGETSTVIQVILPRDVGSQRETWALELVHEALSLIPPESRWDVTYSTFFGGNLPVSISCQWQFILDGTDAAKRARLDPRAKTIDIPEIASKRKPPAQNSLTALTKGASRPWYNDREDSSIARRRTAESHRRSSPEASDADQQGDGEESAIEPRIQPGVKKPGRGISRGFADRPSEPKPDPILARPSSLTVIFLVVAGAAILFVMQAFSGGESSKLQEIVKSSDIDSQRLEEKNQKKRHREQDLRQQEEEKDAKRRQLEDEEKQRLASAVAASTNTAAPEIEMPPDPKPAVVIRATTPSLPPLQEVRDQGNRLELKLPTSGLNSSPDGPVRLAKIHVTSLDHFDLKRIIGGQSVLRSGLDYVLVSNDKKGEPFREWHVIRKSTTGVGLGDKPHVVGTFQLDQNFDLFFRWDRKNDGFEIINCLLEMEAGEPDTKRDKVTCTLREVTCMKPIQFDRNEPKTVARLVSGNQLTNTQAVELFECQFSNLTGKVERSGILPRHVGETVTFQIEGAQKGKYPRSAEIEVTLADTEQGVQIEMELKLGMLSRGDDDPKVKLVPFTPGLLKKADEDIEKGRLDIEKERRKLKTDSMDLEKMKKEAPRDKDGGIKDPKLKTKVDRLQVEVDHLSQLVPRHEDNLEAARELGDDLKKMVDDIATNGRLQFRLRLMFPNAGVGGIELIRTDDSLVR